MDMKCHEFFEEKLLHELELIKSRYTNPTQELTAQDIEKMDKIYHTLKGMRTYCAMACPEAFEEEYGESREMNQNGNSGYRGRAMNGRFVSRESANSYADGYSTGYSEAMKEMNGNGGNSGHYPMMPYAPRRW